MEVQLQLTSDVENFPGYAEAVSGPDLMEDLRKQAEVRPSNDMCCLVCLKKDTRVCCRLRLTTSLLGNITVHEPCFPVLAAG